MGYRVLFSGNFFRFIPFEYVTAAVNGTRLCSVARGNPSTIVSTPSKRWVLYQAIFFSMHTVNNSIDLRFDITGGGGQ